MGANPDDGVTAKDSSTADRVAALMPQLEEELARLVAIPSVSAAGFPEPRQPLLDTYELIVGLLREAGVEKLDSLDLPDTAPVIIGEIPAPDGRPDGAAVRRTTTWCPPATRRSGSRRRSRRPSATARSTAAAAPTRSRTSSCTSARCAPGAGGRPVGIKIVIEGQEEIGSALTTYPPTHPELFAADAMVIGDMGSVRPGVPTLTVGLRGMAGVIVEVRTLAGPKHSGQFGGAAPDALLVLLHALASLHDEQRRRRRAGPAPRGVDRRARTATTSSATWPRSLPGMPLHRHRRPRRADLVRAGDHRDRHRRAARRQGASTPSCRTRAPSSALRIHPEQDPAEAQAALVRHLEGAAAVRDRARGRAPPRPARAISRRRPGPAYEAARAAFATAWGGEPSFDRDRRLDPARQRALKRRRPDAEILLFGTTDGFANIHAPNERVLLDEFEKAVVVEAEFFGRLARPFARRGEHRERAAPAAAGPPSDADDASACSARSSAAATRCRTPRSCSSGCA